MIFVLPAYERISLKEKFLNLWFKEQIIIVCFCTIYHHSHCTAMWLNKANSQFYFFLNMFQIQPNLKYI